MAQWQRHHQGCTQPQKQYSSFKQGNISSGDRMHHWLLFKQCPQKSYTIVGSMPCFALYQIIFVVLINIIYSVHFSELKCLQIFHLELQIQKALSSLSSKTSKFVQDYCKHIQTLQYDHLLCSVVLCCVAMHCIALCIVLVYCIVLCCALHCALYCVLYFITDCIRVVLYCIILYCTVLYYIILGSNNKECW